MPIQLLEGFTELFDVGAVLLAFDELTLANGFFELVHGGFASAVLLAVGLLLAASPWRRPIRRLTFHEALEHGVRGIGLRCTKQWLMDKIETLGLIKSALILPLAIVVCSNAIVNEIDELLELSLLLVRHVNPLLQIFKFDSLVQFVS